MLCSLLLISSLIAAICCACVSLGLIVVVRTAGALETELSGVTSTTVAESVIVVVHAEMVVEEQGFVCECPGHSQAICPF